MPNEVKLLPCEPTHYCVVCAARWVSHPDGSWSLTTPDCGPCCDNVPMDTAPIVKLLPDGSVDEWEYRKVRRSYDAEQRKAQVDRYGGILCALCDEPFEHHFSDWGCRKRVAPRFKFPAALETTSATQEHLNSDNAPSRASRPTTVVTDEVVERLRDALSGLVQTVEKDAHENSGISGFTGARLSDARAALAVVTGEQPQSAFNVLVDLHDALVMTREHNPHTHVISFVDHAAEFDRATKFLRAAQPGDA